MQATESSLLKQSLNATLYGIIEKFQTGTFAREFVVIESGCDFTFNLLPLLLQHRIESKYEPQSKDAGASPQNYHFLKSPYHPTPPSNLSPVKHHVQNLELANSHPNVAGAYSQGAGVGPSPTYIHSQQVDSNISLSKYEH